MRYINKKFAIKNLTRTCLACPSQWEGIDEDVKPIYIRYRWEYLSVKQGKKNKGIFSSVRGKEIFRKQIGDEFDGYLEFKDLQKILKDYLFLPKKEKMNIDW